MKKILIASLFATTALTFNANATTTLPTPVIGIVDAQQILDNSSAANGIKKEIEKKRTDIQKEMAVIEKDLREEDKKLAEDHKKLSEKAYTDKRTAFEKKVIEAQGKMEIRRIQLEDAFQEARTKVLNAFLKAADVIKKTVGANIIIYKDHIVVADANFDVTPKILEQLNKDLPSVKVVYKSENEIKTLIQTKK